MRHFELFLSPVFFFTILTKLFYLKSNLKMNIIRIDEVNIFQLKNSHTLFAGDMAVPT